METSSLDEVAAACTQLSGLLKSAKTPAEKDSLLTNHIATLWSTGESIGDIGRNLEWVNVSRRLSLSADCSDRIVVLDFFTYCCINCMHVLPDLKELEEAHPVKSGLLVIGIHSAKFDSEKETENLISHVRSMSIKHPVVNDPECKLWTRLGIRCWPTVLILGPQLKPIFVLVGEGNREELFLYCGAALRHFGDELKKSEPRFLTPLSHIEAAVVDKLSFPTKVALNPFYRGGPREPFLAISDTGNHRVVLTDYSGMAVNIIGGLDPGFKDGKSWEALLHSPQGLCWLSGTVLVVCDTGNHAIRTIDLESDTVELLCGTGKRAATNDMGGQCLTLQPLSSPWDVVLYTTPDMDMTVRSPLVRPATPTGEDDKGKAPVPPAPPAPAPPPPARAADKQMRRVLLIACAGSHQIWALFLDTTIWWKYKKYEEGTCVCIAGNGAEAARNSSYPSTASFAQPSGLALKLGQCPELFVADSESSSIRRIALNSGQVLPVAGGDRNPLNLFAWGNSDGVGYDAKFQHPLGVSYSDLNKQLYVADSYNNVIRRIDTTTYRVNTVKPTKTENESNAKLNEPSGLAITPDSKYVYIADTNNHAIKILNLAKNTCELFNFRIFSYSLDDVNSTVPYNRDLYINRYSGTLILMFTVKLDSEKNDVELMTGAPQYWRVKMEDGQGNDASDLFDFVNCTTSGSKLPARIHLKLKKKTDTDVFRMKCMFKTSICGNKCFFYSFGVTTQILAQDDAKPLESFKIGFRFNPHSIIKQANQ